MNEEVTERWSLDARETGTITGWQVGRMLVLGKQRRRSNEVQRYQQPTDPWQKHTTWGLQLPLLNEFTGHSKAPSQDSTSDPSSPSAVHTRSTTSLHLPSTTYHLPLTASSFVLHLRSSISATSSTLHVPSSVSSHAYDTKIHGLLELWVHGDFDDGVSQRQTKESRM